MNYVILDSWLIEKLTEQNININNYELYQKIKSLYFSMCDSNNWHIDPETGEESKYIDTLPEELLDKIFGIIKDMLTRNIISVNYRDICYDTEKTVNLLTHALTLMPSITDFSIDDDNCIIDDSNIEDIAKAIKNHPSLESCNLVLEEMCKQGHEALADAYKNHPTLQAIYLSTDTADYLELYADAVKDNITLTNFNIYPKRFEFRSKYVIVILYERISLI